MSIESKWRGNPITFEKGEWIYLENGYKVSEFEMPCGKCGEFPTVEGHDRCLGTLIGVMNACCGHGNDREAYVQFLDGESIDGEDATIIIDVLKRHSKKEVIK